MELNIKNILNGLDLVIPLPAVFLFTVLGLFLIGQPF